jgi:hypothetical protein
VSGAAVLTRVAVGDAVVATAGSGGHGTSQVVQGSGIAVPQSADTATHEERQDRVAEARHPHVQGRVRRRQGQVDVLARFTNSRGTACLEVRVTRNPPGTKMGKTVCPEAMDATAPCSLSPWKSGQVDVHQSLFPARPPAQPADPA